jgi:hypothetical protein
MAGVALTEEAAKLRPTEDICGARTDVIFVPNEAGYLESPAS